MLDENMKNVLDEAQNMFLLNDGMAPIIFMKLEGSDYLEMDYLPMNTDKEREESVNKIKGMIESGKLKEYIYMCEGSHKGDQLCLVVTRASPKEETQCICSVYEHEDKTGDEKYTFDTWLIYDGTNMKSKKNSMINLFGQINCKYN